MNRRLLILNKEDIRYYCDFLGHEKYDFRAFTPRKSNLETNIKKGNLWASNKDEVINLCEKYNEKSNIYLGVLPRESKKKEGIKRVDKIWMELDAKRREDGTASDEKLNKAKKIMEDIRNDYRDYGLPLVVMSGNGYHLIWEIESIELNDKNRKMVDNKLHSFVHELKREYETEDVEVDTAVGEIARILKIPGTTSVKGKKDNWRESKIVYKNNQTEEEKSRLKDYFLMLESTKSSRNKKDLKVDEDFDFKKFNKYLDRDKKLKDLYNGKIEKYNYDSRSEAEFALLNKLIFYEIPENKIRKIMSKSGITKWDEANSNYRDYSLEKAKSGCKKTISEYREIDDELKDKVIDEVFEINNYKRKTKTKFVTFRTDIVIDEERRIDFGKTYEISKRLANLLEEKEIVAEKIWLCLNCKKSIVSEYKPSSCPRCHNDKKDNFKPVHPTQPHQIGNTLIDNYHFKSIIETMSESSPGHIYMYKGGVYDKKTTMGFIRKKVKQMVENSKQNLQRNVIDHIATKETTHKDNMGISGNKLVTKNLVVDLDTDETYDHSPDFMATKEIDCEYDPEPTAEKFEEYLRGIIPDKKDRKRLQEICGTSLVNKKLHKKALIVVGPTDAGKSTLIDILREIYGSDNVSSQSPHSLSNERWGKARLQNVLLNATDEVSSKKLKNLDVLKKICDGNPINAEYKGEKVFRFSPTCEHIFAANQTPGASRKDSAFWNRWIVIEMPSSISEEDKDPDIKEKILEEKSGILNWMIQGYKDFMDNGKSFTYPQDWEDSRNKWLNWGSSIQRFIQNVLVQDNGNKIKTSTVYERYQEYVSNNKNLEVEEQKELTKRIKELPYVKHSSKFRFNGRQSTGFKNLNFVENIEESKKTKKKKSGLDKYEQNNNKTIKRKILSCYPDHNEEPERYLKIEKRAEEKGIKAEELSEWHEKLSNMGAIFSPRNGYWIRN